MAAQVTWFLAWLAIDEKRVAAGRSGLVPCVVRPSPEAGQGEGGAARLGRLYTTLLARPLYQAAVVVASLGLLAVGLVGAAAIRQKFEPELLLPADTYMRRWKTLHDASYPESGWSADVYTGKLEPHRHLAGLDRLTSGLQQLRDNGTHVKGKKGVTAYFQDAALLTDVSSWWTNLKEFAVEEANLTDWRQLQDQNTFSTVLSGMKLQHRSTDTRSS